MAAPLAGTGAPGVGAPGVGAPGVGARGVGAPLTGFSYSEVNALSRIKARDGAAGLQAAAQQFESLFIDLILKGARDATAAIQADDYTSSDATRVQQEMLDHQWAVHLAEHGGVGLSDIIVKQLSGQGFLIRGRGEAGPIATARAHAHEAPSDVSAEPDAARSDKGPTSATGAASASATPAVSPQEAARPDDVPLDVTPLGAPRTLDGSPQTFVDRVLPTLQRALSGTPFNPIAVLAQAALETGWGKRVIHAPDGRSSNNLFGVKAGADWSGDSVTVGTLEYLSGRATQILDRFRAYPSLEAAIEDYASMLSRDPRYRDVVGHAQDPQRFADELQKAGYATDPSYARKLRGVLDSAPLRALRSALGI